MPRVVGQVDALGEAVAEGEGEAVAEGSGEAATEGTGSEALGDAAVEPAGDGLLPALAPGVRVAITGPQATASSARTATARWSAGRRRPGDRACPVRELDTPTSLRATPGSRPTRNGAGPVTRRYWGRQDPLLIALARDRAIASDHAPKCDPRVAREGRDLVIILRSQRWNPGAHR